jgi:hypothetical protein
MFEHIYAEYSKGSEELIIGMAQSVNVAPNLDQEAHQS